MARLLVALKRNRHGQRDWLIGLLIYRHGLRVSEACDLRWDDIDLPKRTIIVRRLKGSTDSTHYLERDEHKALGDLRRAYAAKGIKSDYVFVNERGEPFGRMGIARKIEHAGEAAGLPFPLQHLCCSRRLDLAEIADCPVAAQSDKPRDGISLGQSADIAAPCLLSALPPKS